jgi:hypothetical protein
LSWKHSWVYISRWYLFWFLFIYQYIVTKFCQEIHRYLISWFFFSLTGAWTQGLRVARQVLSTPAMPPAHFCVSYFLHRILWVLPGAGLWWDPPTNTFPVAGSQLNTTTPSFVVVVVEMEVSLTFVPYWPWTVILPISPSWVAGIMGGVLQHFK